MTTWRYLVLGGAALSWGGCSDLPSFPDNFGVGGGSSGGSDSTSTAGSSVIPEGGSAANTAGTASSNAGTTTTEGGSTSAAGTASNAGTTSTEGGSTSTAGTAAMAGSGGMSPNPQVEIDDAVKNLKGWRYENPCGHVDGHSLTDGQCNSGEICWPNSNKTRFAEKKQIAIGGVVGHNYDVTLRVRGAIEPRDYPANCKFLPGGSPNGATISIIDGCDGFANAGQVTFNVWEFTIQEPKHTYYLNAVKLHPPHRVDAIDQNFTIRVAGGTKIDFAFDDLNGGEIRNCSVTVQGIEPYPKAFDGNFFQIDVVDAKLVP